MKGSGDEGSGEEGRWGRGSSMRFLKLWLQIAL